MAGIGSLYVSIVANTAKFQTGMSKAGKIVHGFKGNIAGLKSKMGGLATSMVGLGAGFISLAGAAMAMRRSLSMTEGVNRSMASSLAIMGDVSEKTRQQMMKTAHDVAYSTVYSTKEAAGAYYFLTSAGMDAAQSIAALPSVAKFAQAGMFDLSRATDLFTDTQMAMGLSSKDAAKNLQSLIIMLMANLA